MSEVTLGEKGIAEEWNTIFPNRRVPVLNTQFLTDKKAISEDYIMVNWKVLTPEQKIMVIRKLASKFKASETEVCDQLDRYGLPLRKSFTTGIVCTPLRYFL